MMLWMDGFDHYGTTANMLEGVYAEINSDAALSTVNPRTGAYCLRFPSQQDYVRRTLGALKETCGFGYAFYCSALPAVSEAFHFANYRDSGNLEQCHISLTSDGRFALYRGATLLETSEQVVTADSYQHLEFRVRIHDTDGSCEIRRNGETVLEAVGLDTKGQTEAGSSQILWGYATATGGSATMDCDDAFAWDLTADPENPTVDFVGDRGVYLLLPDSDGTETGWVRNTGSSDWSAIDEVPPDGDTSYIEAAATYDTSDFGLSALPGEVVAITALMAVPMMRKTDAGPGSVQVSMVSGGDVVSGDQVALTTAYTYYGEVFALDPDTGAPWTPAAVNAAQLRFERTL